MQPKNVSMSSTGAWFVEFGAGTHRPHLQKGVFVQLRLIWIAFLTMSAASLGHALDNAYPDPPLIELCEDVVLPTHVYTADLDLEFERFAQGWLEEEQDIGLTRAVYSWTEPVPFAVFVDLFHTPAGGLIEVQIHDHHGNPTWSTIQPVPRRMGEGGLVREVLVVPISLFDMETAFPRTSVYAISAASFPVRGVTDACAFSASTSVMVDPSYPSAFP